MRKKETKVVLETHFKSSHRDLNEISILRLGGGGGCLSVRGIGVFWKITCVRGLDRASWKKTYLFDKNPP